jgi:hypothetical protein
MEDFISAVIKIFENELAYRRSIRDKVADDDYIRATLPVEPPKTS